MENQNDTITLLKTKLQQERSAGNEFRWAMMDMSDRMTRGGSPRLALQVESIIAMHDKLRGKFPFVDGNMVTAEPAPVNARRFAHNLAATMCEIDNEIAANEMSSAEITAEAAANHVQ